MNKYLVRNHFFCIFVILFLFSLIEHIPCISSYINTSQSSYNFYIYISAIRIDPKQWVKRKKERWESERKKEEEEEEEEGEETEEDKREEGEREKEFKFPEALSCTSSWNLECSHPWLVTIRYILRKQNPETRKSVMQHLIRHFGHTQTMSARYSSSSGLAHVPQ